MPITQVEVVNPKLTGEEIAAQVITGILVLATRVLIIWWAVAAWFPELGLTYWQLILPVYAVRMLFQGGEFRRKAKTSEASETLQLDVQGVDKISSAVASRIALARERR